MVLKFEDCSQLIVRKGPLYTSIVVTTYEATHSFRTFIKDEARINIVKTIWLNATSNAEVTRSSPTNLITISTILLIQNRLSPQDLYDTINKPKINGVQSVVEVDSAADTVFKTATADVKV